MALPRVIFWAHRPSFGLLFSLLALAAFGCSKTLSGQSTKSDTGSGGNADGGAGERNGDGDGDTGDGDGDGDGDTGDGDTGDGDGDGDTGDGDGDGGGGAPGTGGANSGGSESGGSNSGGTGGIDVEDTEPPSVVSTSPTDGASGVTADEEMVIEFSEAMDTASTEAAFASSSLPGSPSFSWGDGDTKLTISLSEPFAYAEGASTSVTARDYGYTISSGATDVAGNELPSLDVNFTTLRHIAMVLLGVPVLDGFVQSDGAYEEYEIGDAVAGWYTDRELVTFLTFDLTFLPDNIVDFEAATLYAYQLDSYTSVDPYADFGELMLQHTIFSGIDSDELAMEPLRSLGVFSSSSGLGWRSADVLAALNEDYTLRVSRQNRTQYWLRFPGGPGDNMAYNARAFYVSENEENPPRIDVVYWVP